MADRRSRLGVANLSLPLMLLTFVGIGGFLWWLNLKSESVEIEVVEATGPVNTGGAAFTPVTEDDLREAERFVGQTVRAADMAVAGQVGTQAFFLDLPDLPFLVMLSEELVAQGTPIPRGQVTVTGPILAMTDSIMNDWMGRALVPASDQILLEFSTHFIEARSVEAPPEDQ